MKENILDVLMYLFEHYMDSENSELPEQESLRKELVDVGFTHNEVDKAFDWLEGLANQKAAGNQGLKTTTTRSIRVFNNEEIKKINIECRGFLLFLDQIGVLDATNRELVIDRVMALEGDEIDLRDLKWIILMVLFNQPGQEAAFAWIEDQVFEEYMPTAH